MSHLRGLFSGSIPRAHVTKPGHFKCRLYMTWFIEPGTCALNGCCVQMGSGAGTLFTLGYSTHTYTWLLACYTWKESVNTTFCQSQWDVERKAVLWAVAVFQYDSRQSRLSLYISLFPPIHLQYNHPMPLFLIPFVKKKKRESIGKE